MGKLIELLFVRGRQGAQAMLKTKNNMLTAVLVVTTLPPSVPVSLELVDQICYTVGRAAAEMNEVSGLRRCGKGTAGTMFPL